jgi:hypothetical protein
MLAVDAQRGRARAQDGMTEIGVDGAGVLDPLVTRVLSQSAFRFILASTDAEREIAYRLGYRAVVEQGWLPPARGDRLEQDEYDERAIHVLGWDGDEPISTGRLVLPRGLPTEAACGLVVEPSGRVVDVGRMCVVRSPATGGTVRV